MLHDTFLPVFADNFPVYEHPPFLPAGRTVIPSLLSVPKKNDSIPPPIPNSLWADSAGNAFPHHPVLHSDSQTSKLLLSSLTTDSWYLQAHQKLQDKNIPMAFPGVPLIRCVSSHFGSYNQDKALINYRFHYNADKHNSLLCNNHPQSLGVSSYFPLEWELYCIDELFCIWCLAA